MKTISEVVLAVAIGGCGIIKVIPQSGASSVGDPDGVHLVHDGNTTYRVGPYWGPECEREPVNAVKDSRLDEPSAGKQPNLANEPADQVLRLVCQERILGVTSDPDRNTWVMQHFRFDDVFFDHWTAGMIVVECAEAESCLDIRAPKWKRDQGVKAGAYYQVAMARYYADHVDPAVVKTRLDELPLAPAAKVVYLQLLDEARKQVIAACDQLPPEVKQLFVGIPEQVYAQHAAAIAPHAKVVNVLAQLALQLKAQRAKGTISDETIAGLHKLRVQYHASCKKDCTRDAIFTAITKQLFYAYVARGDSASAMAEAKLIEQAEPSAAEEIAKNQTDAIQKAEARLGRVEQARKQGVDADVARSTAQGNVIDLGDGRHDVGYVYEPSDEVAIRWEDLIPDGRAVGQFHGKVAAIEAKAGNLVLVRFADEVSSHESATNCYETNRVDRIENDGRIVYREQCTGSATYTDRTKVEPILMPSTEVAGLHGGDEVLGFSQGDDKGTRVGRVWQVKRGNRVARLRDVSL
jgi:hypothetical protein